MAVWMRSQAARLPSRILPSPASSMTSLGSRAMILTSMPAAPDGVRSPRSYLRTVPSEAPVALANSAWVRPAFRRVSATKLREAATLVSRVVGEGAPLA